MVERIITLDELDIEILRLIAENCDMSAREIAKKLGKSPTTIVLRLRKLRNLGILKGCHARIDYSRLGYNITILLHLDVEPKHVDSVAASLSKMPNVRQVLFTAGPYNLHVLALFKSINELNKFILSVLSNHHIKRSIVSIVIKNYKDDLNIAI